MFSCWVVSDSLWPHGLQHARLPCPPPTPRVHPNLCPLSLWCHPTTSSSVVPSPLALNLSQHQGLFQWVISSHQVTKILQLQLQHQCFPRGHCRCSYNICPPSTSLMSPDFHTSSVRPRRWGPQGTEGMVHSRLSCLLCSSLASFQAQKELSHTLRYACLSLWYDCLTPWHDCLSPWHDGLSPWYHCV